ncbi:MAG: hypothetical protein Q9M17_03740 [Mariprofundus sp.]|nr:hypothetical protein [Mariprofundus sp.]
MKKINISLLLIMLCAMLLSACAAQPRLWLAKSISSAGLKVDGRASDQVVLKLPNQVVAGSINRATVQSLLDVHAKIDVVALMHSILYITNRGEPYANAYAATIGGEYIIAINLSMIALLGSD